MVARRPEGIDEVSRQIGALQSDVSGIKGAIVDFKSEIAASRNERNEMFEDFAEQMKAVSSRTTTLENMVKTSRTLATGFSAGIIFAVGAFGLALGIGITKIAAFIERIR